MGDQKVVLGLSGGVDSSVAAALLHKAIGDQLTCIFVNNGLLRSHEEEMVQRVFGENFHIRLKYVDGADRFLKLLEGVTDPETKRKIIGNEFVKVFEHATEELLAEDKANGSGEHRGYHFLAQGTLYPDVIESVAIGGNPAHVIKSHHNVGGSAGENAFRASRTACANCLRTRCVRPDCSSVCRRKSSIVSRSRVPDWPYGFSEKLLLNGFAFCATPTPIVISEMKASDWYYRVWQSFAVLLPVRSVGVMGDQRTYENTIAIRVGRKPGRHDGGLGSVAVRIAGADLQLGSSTR